MMSTRFVHNNTHVLLNGVGCQQNLDMYPCIIYTWQYPGIYRSQNIFGVFCDGTIQENHNGRAANKYLT